MRGAGVPDTTAFKCQVATAENCLSVSVMQEPVEIWECRVAKGRQRKRQGQVRMFEEKERGWDCKRGSYRRDEAGKVEGWGRGAHTANREPAKAEWRDGWIRSGSLDWGECGRCSLSGLQSVSRVPLVPSGRITQPCLILRSHPLPCPHAPSCPRQCTSLHSDFATGIKIDNVFVSIWVWLLTMQNCILNLGSYRVDHMIPILF